MSNKFIAILVGVSFLGSIISGALMPSKVEAAVPVFETNGALIASNLQTSASTFTNLGQNLYEWAYTFIISSLKRRVLDVVVDQIIGYIQGGGKPQFVTDWRGFLENAGQAAAGDFAQEVGLGFLCNPFSLQVQINLLPVPKFSQQAQCTLDKIVQNIQSFYNDFRAGGWIAYGTAWEPQNNFFGSLLLTSLESERRQGLAKEAAYNEANAGDGYLSAKDRNGNIITPGATLGSLTAKAVGSDIDYILSAEQLSDYASAIANALFNRVLKEGVARVQTAISGRDAQSNTNQLIANNFIFQKDSVLTQINQTLLPRQDAKVILNSSLAVLNDYKSKLLKLRSDFIATGKTSCQSINRPQESVNVTAVKQSILDEIAAADITVAQVQDDLAQNQAIIDMLTAAVTEINSLPNNNTGYVRLNEINAAIAGQINPAEAINFKSAAEEQEVQINDDTTKKLSTFNQQLTICQQSQ